MVLSRAMIHLVALLFAVAEAPPAAAVAASAPSRTVIALDLGAAYRVGATGLSAIRVDGDGALLGQDMLVQHRLSLTPTLALRDTVKLVSELQVAAGYLAVDDPAGDLAAFGPPRDESGLAFGDDAEWRDQLHVRKLYLEWRTPMGVLRAGRQAATWGLGILSNAGEDERLDWGEPRFGSDRNFGDIYDRVLFATAPFAALSDGGWLDAVTVALGGDIVVRDERTVRADGDLAAQGIGVARYRDEAHELGVYVVRREGVDANDESTKVWAYDFFGRITETLGAVELSAVAEVAYIDGTTTVARNNAFTGELEVAQLGYVVRAGGRFVPLDLGLDVELGYASGDSNPNDRYVRNFTFDRDYNPSLIMFEEMRAAETVAAAAAASDPARVGYPSTSVRYLPSGGAVSNAYYVRPTLRYRLVSETAGELGVRLAALWARTEEDNVDPYSSNVAGGTPRNFQNGDGTARDLGLEVNVGIDYAIRLGGGLDLLAGVQAGRLFPGDAFANAAGERPEPVDAVFAKLVGRFDSGEARAAAPR